MSLGVMAISACNTNPFLEEWKGEYAFPPFDKIKTSDYVPAVKAGIKQQSDEINAIVSNNEAPTFANTIAAYELSGETLSKVLGVLYNVSESDATPEMQTIMDEVTPLVTESTDNIFMNKAFFERVKAVYADSSSLDREQYMVTKKLYSRFIDNGVALADNEQVRFKEINAELASLSQKFGNNLLAENNAFKETIGIPVSSYPVFMTTCDDRAKREAAFKAYSSRGNHDNANDTKQILLDIIRLRTEKAQMLGYSCAADMILNDKMAHDHSTVDTFLDKIMVKAVAKAKGEILSMQKFMDKDIESGILPEGSKIQPWDWWYYSEKVRKAEYDLNEEETKPYFELNNVRNGVFKAAEMLYDIKIEQVNDLPVYNSEVETFKVSDKDGGLIGIFMTDYLPRSVKRGGAWMSNFRDQYTDAAGNDIRPIIVNVCNFGQPDDTVKLLSIDEIQTAFHEFGHALHGLLTKCHYKDVSGTSVAHDFVETFSQFNENWAFQPEILAKYARHYKTGEIIPDSLVTKINNALKFNQGFAITELCAASILDIKWHELGSDTDWNSLNISSFENEVCENMGLVDEIIPRYRSTYFNHIFGGAYGAGYYGYLWAEVIDRDLFEFWESKGLWNHENAVKFRKTFLEKGGSEEPMTLYREFCGEGANPDPDALLRAHGL